MTIKSLEPLDKSIQNKKAGSIPAFKIPKILLQSTKQLKPPQTIFLSKILMHSKCTP